jgi:hypothetical protein
MADAERAAHVEGFGDGCDIAAEIAPGVWRLGLAAASVAADLDRDTAPVGERARDLIPCAPVKTRGVSE